MIIVIIIIIIIVIRDNHQLPLPLVGSEQLVVWSIHNLLHIVVRYVYILLML